MVTGAVAVAVVLVLAAGFGVFWRWRDGRMRGPKRGGGEPGAAAGEGAGTQVTGGLLGAELGERATLLQFSSAFCAPCRATRRLLAEVAGGTDGVRHVELDVDDRLDLVRLLDVRRTPTVFVLGPDGRIARQASGRPSRADVVAAVALAQQPGGGK